MTNGQRQLRILVTGGGSGGHVTPALATVEAIKALADQDGTWRPAFLYIGSHSGIERQMAQAAGLPFTAMPPENCAGRSTSSVTFPGAT